METLEYKTIDKSEWSRGPWDNEPDKKQWLDEETGFPCLIVRGPSGALCGYVGVSKSHPFFGVSYHSSAEEGEDWSGAYNRTPGGLIDVHGGLTFSDKCVDHSREKFEKWKENILSRKAQEEREKYPIGDASRRWKNWGHLVDDYEGWVKKLEATSICHTVCCGEDDEVWWFGFDCAHSGDVSPAYDSLGGSFSYESYYRTLGYVTTEVKSLARQLKQLATELTS